MTVITDNIKNIAQVPSGSSVWFSTDLRTTATGIVESKQHEASPDAQGNISIDLIPGPAKVRFAGSLAGDLRITVPASGPVTLRSLITAALLIPPDSPIELLQTAVELYLQENPIEGGGDLTKAVADQTYVPLTLKPDGITYNGDGTVANSTSGGIKTVYTWNADGTVNTETSQGLRKTWVYTNGLPTSSTVQAV
ncbi:hypothetical protein [Rhodococcus sp. MEB064]|uniref:hypothetical protein n=1 Tax=Rhodococcus sp. MEB064 TaxID=1587522 RepID=UPI0005AC37D8|nr:hypothetical protein [Rhodococcus sp. MEB064]KIQ15346.1 hypothetical protein RU01_15575 [Rhodococcus sp. MEB064]